MGNWSLYGILLITGVFFSLVALILTQIEVTNPLTGYETSVFQSILGWIIP